jgi:hypothetical protein
MVVLARGRSPRTPCLPQFAEPGGPRHTAAALATDYGFVVDSVNVSVFE